MALSRRTVSGALAAFALVIALVAAGVGVSPSIARIAQELAMALLVDFDAVDHADLATDAGID